MQTIPEECQAVIEQIVRISRDFLSVGEQLQGMAFVGRYGAGFTPLPMDMSHKDLAAKILTLFCRDVKADYVIMISEAWALMKNVDQEEVERIAKTRESIEFHPDREDVVMITLEIRQGRWISTTPIKTLNGNARDFSNPKFIFSQYAEGRFASFLHSTLH